MAALAVRSEYGPSLARLLAPRWRTTPPRMRALLGVAVALILALVLAVVLTLLNAEYAHGGRVPFSFAYRGLYRVAPEPGGYVRVQRRDRAGALEDSFAVNPLVLPPYAGALSGELPLYATAFIKRVARRYPGFELRGEGKTKLTTTLFGYQIAYTARVEGHELYGRDVLLLPERTGARVGVDVAMLTTPGENSEVPTPIEVGTAGILERPLKSFAFG